MCLLVQCRVDPFAKDSPMKQMSVERFPSDFFFVLRVLQILRCGTHMLS